VSSFNGQDTILIEKALKAAENAYAPYSHFHVGSALITTQGNVYSGCNVENAAYGATNCAERTAIFSAVANEGPNMRIKTIVALCKDVKGNLLDGCACGICRQVIDEFSTPETNVIYRFNGSLVTNLIHELLPNAFTKSNLDVMANLAS